MKKPRTEWLTLGGMYYAAIAVFGTDGELHSVIPRNLEDRTNKGWNASIDEAKAEAERTVAALLAQLPRPRFEVRRIENPFDAWYRFMVVDTGDMGQIISQSTTIDAAEHIARLLNAEGAGA